MILFNYAAEVLHVVDGDTVDLRVDCGFHITVAIRTRLMGINAPELSTAAGQTAKAYMMGLLPAGTQVTVATHKYPGDKYGRWLAVITPVGSMETVNAAMLASGNAVPML